jgi:biopolymer transport protein ExbD
LESAGKHTGLLGDINTTPLVDVMLVLIIIFLITIPVQLHSVNLDMQQSVTSQTKKPNIVRIETDARNVVNWKGNTLANRVALDALRLDAKAQGKAKYEAVACVLASTQRQGLTKIGIVSTEQFATP